MSSAAAEVGVSPELRKTDSDPASRRVFLILLALLPPLALGLVVLPPVIALALVLPTLLTAATSGWWGP